MTLIQYILFANLYLMVFWVAHRLWLNKLTSFGGVRAYLNLAPLLSALLPLAQFALGELLSKAASPTISQELPLAGIIFSYAPITTAGHTIPQGPDPVRIAKYILLLGSASTLLTYSFLHLRILFLSGSGLSQSTFINNLRIIKTRRVSIPFIYYNRILIPDTTAEKDIQQIVQHESMHYQNAHHLDNTLYSIMHVLYWFNPFFLLLRSALKLNHEFQVDSQMISSGIDPVSYKLSLVRYSVGNRLFSLANGLSNTNTYKRIQMIDKKGIHNTPWRFILPAPILILLFSAFTFACIQPRANEEQPQTLPEAVTESVVEDTLKMKFIDPMSGVPGKEVKWDKNSMIVVLMNRNSEVMIDREVTELQDVEQRIISDYNKKLDDRNVTQEIKVHVYKDIMTDDAKFQSMLEYISHALLKVRDMQSIRLYGKTYIALEEAEKKDIDMHVPYRVYGTFPRVLTTYDTRPKFKGENEIEFMRYVAHNLEYPESLAQDSISGRVLCQIILKADGSIGDVALANSVHPLMDQEIIRVVKSSPRWTPAMLNGEPVPCTLEFPISLALR